MRKIFVRILALWVCISLFATFAAKAEEKTNIKYDGTGITVSVKIDGQPVPGAVFRLYYVASKHNGFTLYGSFSHMKTAVDMNDKAQRNTAADYVKGYTFRENIEPFAASKTDKNGNVTFDDLKTGLYLVCGDGFAFDDDYYTVTPFFAEFTKGQNDIMVFPKTESVGKDDFTVTRKVIIEWNDEETGRVPPEGVTVILFKDGKEYDRVVVTKKDKWRYTWEKLPKNHDWLVYEDVPQGYVATLSRDGVTFEIMNINGGKSPQKPTETQTETEPQKSPEKEKLPNTGQLWWPVMIMTAVGLLFIIAGLVCRRSDDDE